LFRAPFIGFVRKIQTLQYNKMELIVTANYIIIVISLPPKTYGVGAKLELFIYSQNMPIISTRDSACKYSQNNGGMKMAISPVTLTNSTAVSSNAAVMPVNKETIHSKPQPTGTDDVQISSAARAKLQEATETASQTAREARSGDFQAQRRQARREAAAEEATESPAARAQEAQATSADNLPL
jgi:hypothetical protein